MVPKFDLQIEALGALDELQSWLGVVLAQLSPKTQSLKSELITVQRQLYYLQADLNVAASNVINAEDVTNLEQRIDTIMAQVPAIKAFILPGGQITGANLQYARTLARRAERTMANLHLQQTKINPILLQYINRLSDYLFALARYANLLDDYTDIPSKTRA